MKPYFCLLAVMAVHTGAVSIQFRDATGASGIRFLHTDGSTGKRYIVETVTCGLGLIDYNNDGWLDILFLNGAPLADAARPAVVPTNHLYRNNRDGTYTDVTTEAKLDLSAYAMGCTVADYDNDGLEDVFITNYGRHRLLRNTGPGGFLDMTEPAGLTEASTGPNCIGAGCIFLDYDRDGYLDLFVGNYLEFDMAKAQPCRQAEIPIYCSPRIYPMGSNRLFHNQGNGSFRDVSDSSGIARHKGYAMGVVSADFDGDGWPDIFVGNDVMENFLFRNKGNGTFEEIGLLAGVAYDQYGDPQGSMGANAGDYDGDGRFDVLVTDFQNQMNTLYRNLGVASGLLQFQDVTVRTGAGNGSRPLVTWGCGLVDFDNDGIPEIFTAAGHLQDNVEKYDSATTYKQRSLLLQQRSGRFIDISQEVGGPLLHKESSRGAVFGDLNNDGKVDIVVLNARAKPAILMNSTHSSNHWLILKLVGSRSNRSAIGSFVRVIAAQRTQVGEVRAGRGYQSAEDLRLHFGLGTARRIDRLEIRWPSGRTEERTEVPVDQVLTIVEGQSTGR